MGSHYTQKQHIERKRWRAASPNEWRDLENKRKKEDKTGRLMKGKRRDTNKAANETDASTCCDLFLFI